jgi:hypothetical protein
MSLPTLGVRPGAPCSAAPGNCSSHGHCGPAGTCECDYYFTGTRCTHPFVAHDSGWFLAFEVAVGALMAFIVLVGVHSLYARRRRGGPQPQARLRDGAAALNVLSAALRGTCPCRCRCRRWCGLLSRWLLLSRAQHIRAFERGARVRCVLAPVIGVQRRARARPRNP